MSARPFVCLLTYLKNQSPIFTKFSVHITCARGSVLWQQCNTRYLLPVCCGWRCVFI